MKRARIIVVLLVLCFIFAVAGIGQGSSRSANQTQQAGQKNGNLAKGDTKLSIELDRDTYTLRDTPKIKISIKNDSKLPIMILKTTHSGIWASLFAAVFDDTGNALDPEVIFERRVRPPFREEDFKLIKTGEAFTTEDWFPLQPQGIKAPGTYKLFITYQSPVDSDYAPKGLNVLVKEMGSLEAEPVTFKVIQ